MSDLESDIRAAVQNDLNPHGNTLRSAMAAADASARPRPMDGGEAKSKFLNHVREWQENTQKARVNAVQRHKDDMDRLLDQRRIEIANHCGAVERAQKQLEDVTQAKIEAERWFADQINDKEAQHLESLNEFDSLTDMCDATTKNGER